MLYQFDMVLAVAAVIRGAQTTPDAVCPHRMLCSSAGGKSAWVKPGGKRGGKAIWMALGDPVPLEVSFPDNCVVRVLDYVPSCFTRVLKYRSGEMLLFI